MLLGHPRSHAAAHGPRDSCTRAHASLLPSSASRSRARGTQATAIATGRPPARSLATSAPQPRRRCWAATSRRWSCSRPTLRCATLDPCARPAVEALAVGVDRCGGRSLLPDASARPPTPAASHPLRWTSMRSTSLAARRCSGRRPPAMSRPADGSCPRASPSSTSTTCATAR